jgi:hypothetical protein
MPRLLIPLALAGICAALLTVTIRFGSFVAGGSDSSCYVIQAERWARAVCSRQTRWRCRRRGRTPSGRSHPPGISPLLA